VDLVHVYLKGLVFVRWMWYLIVVKVNALWVGEDEVDTLGIGRRCNGGACMWAK